MNSKLVTLFDNIIDLDWDKININSLKSRLIYICELFNDNVPIDEICFMNGITYDSCTSYLRKGTAYGLCNYSGNENRNKVLKKNEKRSIL